MAMGYNLSSSQSKEMIDMMTVVLYSAANDVFISAIAPIVTAIVGAVFTYLGLRLSNKAKRGDQNIASQAQQYEGMAMGQQFLKDALEDARATIVELKAENAQGKEHIEELQILVELGGKRNDKLEAQISRLEAEVEKLALTIKE